MGPIEFPLSSLQSTMELAMELDQRRWGGGGGGDGIPGIEGIQLFTWPSPLPTVAFVVDTVVARRYSTVQARRERRTGLGTRTGAMVIEADRACRRRPWQG